MNDDIGNFPQLLKADAKQRIRKKIRIDLPNGIIDTATPDEGVQVPSYPDALNQLRSVEWSGIKSWWARRHQCCKPPPLAVFFAFCQDDDLRPCRWFSIPG